MMTYLTTFTWCFTAMAFDWERKTNSENMECAGNLLKQRNFLELGMSLSSPHMRTSESSEESSVNKSPSGDGFPKGSVLHWDQETPFFTSLSSGKTQFFPGAADARSPHSSLLPFKMYLSS